jgi:hypothetical protein
MLFVMLFTSKGVVGVTGGGFVALAATIPAVGILPVGGLTLLLGVDRFMSEIRAAGNLTSNIVVRWWWPGGRAPSTLLWRSRFWAGRTPVAPWSAALLPPAQFRNRRNEWVPRGAARKAAPRSQGELIKKLCRPAVSVMSACTAPALHPGRRSNRGAAAHFAWRR